MAQYELPSTASPSSTGLTRRAALRRLAGWMSLASVGGSFGYAWLIEPHWIEVVRRPLPIAGLPNSLRGRTLVQISDLHIGPVVDDAYLIQALQRVALLEPDILVITGDFMTTKHGEELEHVRRVLCNLAPARLATLAILGNHDYGFGYHQVSVADRLTACLTDLGIEVLCNTQRDVLGLQVVGFDDLWSPRFAGGQALGEVDLDRPSLVLCHNPDGADRPIWKDYHGWILAGHTHGGQCRIPFGPAPVLPVQNKRYVAGEVSLTGRRRLYINRGLGYTLPCRFNVRPEITVFTLVPEKV